MPWMVSARASAKDKIEVEGTATQLNKVLTALDILSFTRPQREAQLEQGSNDSRIIVRRLIHKDVGILSGIRVAEQDGA
jgi:hypothetical protein